jgi:hypothetical protein
MYIDKTDVLPEHIPYQILWYLLDWVSYLNPTTVSIGIHSSGELEIVASPINRQYLNLESELENGHGVEDRYSLFSNYKYMIDPVSKKLDMGTLVIVNALSEELELDYNCDNKNFNFRYQNGNLVSRSEEDRSDNHVRIRFRPSSEIFKKLCDIPFNISDLSYILGYVSKLTLPFKIHLLSTKE